MENEVELIDVPRVIYGLRVVDELAKCFASGYKKPRKQFGYWKRAAEDRLLEKQKQKTVEYDTAGV